MGVVDSVNNQHKDSCSGSVAPPGTGGGAGVGAPSHSESTPMQTVGGTASGSGNNDNGGGPIQKSMTGAGLATSIEYSKVAIVQSMPFNRADSN